MTVPGFAARFRAGEQLVGGLLRMPNEQLTELVGRAGLDFVVIDTEHGAADGVALHHHVAIAQGAGLGVLVRVGATTEISRVLDLGVDGVVVPHVEDAAAAVDAVAACRYPPRGVRGFAAYTRAADYGLRSGIEHLQLSEAGPVVVAMLEDPHAVETAATIGAVDGVDALMLGPADLAVELGALGATEDVRVSAARREVRRAARASGVADVVILGTRQAADAALAAGTTVVVYNLQAAVTDLVRTLVPGTPGQRSTPGPAAPSAAIPLVLLSGMLGDTTVWDGVAGRLADDVRCLPLRHDLYDDVALAAAGVLAEAPERFGLVGHSLGGIVAMEIVRQAPERVAGLALLNTSARPGSDAQVESWTGLAERVERGEFAAVADELAVATLPGSSSNRAMAETLGAEGLLRQLRAQLSRPDARGHLSGVRVPTIVVSGEQDTISPVELQREIAGLVPGAEHVLLPGGHMSPLEQPAALADALRRWWQGL